jgi:hypothetical protein
MAAECLGAKRAIVNRSMANGWNTVRQSGSEGEGHALESLDQCIIMTLTIRNNDTCMSVWGLGMSMLIMLEQTSDSANHGANTRQIL